ncbi:16877_t:CDS:2, partial [Funneliformis mosseae]
HVILKTEDSSQSELCNIEKLKSDLHNELSLLAHISTLDQTSEEQDLSSDIIQNIVCMFRKANKLSQEAILYWYYFIEKYDKRINNIVADGVKKKAAIFIVYQEIK